MTNLDAGLLTFRPLFYLCADEFVETNLKTHNATFKNLSVFDGNPQPWQKSIGSVAGRRREGSEMVILCETLGKFCPVTCKKTEMRGSLSKISVTSCIRNP
jgi:hypothetical protein